MAKEAFNRNISSKINIEHEKKSVMYYVWSITLYGSETWTIIKLERKYLENFKILYWSRKEKIWIEKVTLKNIFNV